MKGYCYPDFIAKPILFTKKIVFAEQILSVLNKIEPGISSSKGVVYYEMQMPIFLKAQMNLSQKRIDAKQAKKEFKKSIDCLQKSMEHLKYNSKGGFHFEFVCIGWVINHMTCYNLSAVIIWNDKNHTGEQILFLKDLKKKCQ